MKEERKESLNLANRYYETEDYKRKDQLSSGLAETHEQVNDAYIEGEIRQTNNGANGQDLPD
ncbi:DUF4025 domain-containing protein [Bacillus methanolicus]|uniref:YozQ family protein n=1 Tax=Bacillus methanolicus TaxID=1471 RepID=UPI00200FC3C5|nr:YozQ family protein [Bacillus methanolicus]UQD52055.1 DUF4025 domain-containing protein [Bacillus methanolicus]